MNLEIEREAFEKWYNKAYMNTDIGYLMHNGQYSSRRKQHSWDAWMASASREGYKLVPLEMPDSVLYDLHYGGYSWGEIDDTKSYFDPVYKSMLGACDD